LGIQHLVVEDLILLLEGVCASGKLNGSPGTNEAEALGTTFIARWLFLFFQAWCVYMHSSANSSGSGGKELMLPDKLSKRISVLHFLPLSDGSLTSLGQGQVFFASEEPFAPEAREAMKHFAWEIRFLDASFESGCCNSSNMKASVHRALGLIGVCPLSEKLVVEEHVVPRLQELLTSPSESLGQLQAEHALGQTRMLPLVCDPSGCKSWTPDLEVTKKLILAYLRFIKGHCCPKGTSTTPNAKTKILSTLVAKLGGLPLPICVVKESTRIDQQMRRTAYDLRPVDALCFVAGCSTASISGSTDVHLPASFTTCPELTKEFFGGISKRLHVLDWKVLDMNQLTGHLSWEKDVVEWKSWKDFFRVLALADFVAVRERRIPVEEIRSPGSIWERSFAVSHPLMWEDLLAEKRWIKDFVSPELEGLLSTFSKPGKLSDMSEVEGPALVACNAILGILCRIWPSVFEKRAKVQIHGGHEGATFAAGLVPSQVLSPGGGRNASLLTSSMPASSCVRSLAELPWLPAASPGVDVRMLARGFLYRADSIFTELQPQGGGGGGSNIAFLFRNLAPMLDHRLAAPLSFVKALGIRTTVDVPCVLRQLQRWSKTPSFVTCIAMMEQLYCFLCKEVYEQCEHTASIRAAFHREALVWVPSRAVEVMGGEEMYQEGQHQHTIREALVEGDWYSLEGSCTHTMH
jgi:hypothetical protein